MCVYFGFSKPREYSKYAYAHDVHDVDAEVESMLNDGGDDMTTLKNRLRLLVSLLQKARRAAGVNVLVSS